MVFYLPYFIIYKRYEIWGINIKKGKKDKVWAKDSRLGCVYLNRSLSKILSKIEQIGNKLPQFWERYI